MMKIRRETGIAVALILLTSALSYLLLAQRFGFYFDDWYLAYAGAVNGPDQFWKVFAIDRPFRAPFVGIVFEWFGLNAPLYSYLSYALRAAGAFGMYAMMRVLWPRQAYTSVLGGVLFVLYPGWTDQPAAFDYQSHLLAFALMVISLAVTVKAARMGARQKRALLSLLAVTMQVSSLFLMEYYIGLEGLRLALILYALLPLAAGQRTTVFLRRAALNWLPYLSALGLFLYWRVFVFSSTRAATDIGGMFSGLLSSPVRRGLDLLFHLFLDFFNVIWLAWGIPFYSQISRLDLREALFALAVGLACAGIVWRGMWWLRQSAPETESSPTAFAMERKDGLAMIWLGSLGVLFSLIPIGLGDRHVAFMSFTRFTLPGSVGAILVLTGALVAYTRKPLQTLLPILLVFFAGAFHYSNSFLFAEQWQRMRDFWWQVSWRAPQIAPGTVLAVEYAGVPISEDYFVWGPANLIYYPQAHHQAGQLFTPLGAVVLTNEQVINIIQRQALLDRERRGLLSPQDMSKVLVLSQPTPGSCVAVMDGAAPELSDRTSDRIARIAAYSNLDRIDPLGTAHIPPAALFGNEPEKGFCYFYQKAALARQREDWQEVARLGDEVQAADLRPAEWVEWMPFAQAYAYTGRFDEVDRIADLYRGVPFLHDQACYIIRDDPRRFGEKFAEGHNYLVTRFCE